MVEPKPYVRLKITLGRGCLLIAICALLLAARKMFDPALPPEAQPHLERVISCLQPKGVVSGGPDLRPMVRPRVKIDRRPHFS
jgi:hypothetical protein